MTKGPTLHRHIIINRCNVSTAHPTDDAEPVEILLLLSTNCTAIVLLLESYNRHLYVITKTKTKINDFIRDNSSSIWNNMLINKNKVKRT